MKNRFASFLRFCFLFILIVGATFQPQYAVYAAANLTVTPLTWNVIGLDSNDPASGPYRFPVGARVCNTVPGTTTATNVVVDFVWDSTNGNINLRSGSLDPIVIASLPVGSCSDAYFEVEVNRVAAAYDTFRQYHITATDSLGATGSTPTPRALYVEHLISQNRNAITDVRLNGTSIPAGGSMNLLVGNTYTIELYGGTATQGYNQFEAFINFPNTIFQILSVSTTYSANNSPYVSSPNDKLYADACLWENDPNSPNYRSCVGGDFKTGGSNVVTTYTIRIISGGGTTQTLNTLLYDFSGSSYHYNADYSTGVRFANIIDPTNVTIAKSFSPNPGSVNGVSALTITITNPNPGAISGYNFTDPLPANMTVASTPGATTTSCGSPTFAPVAGANSITFSNGTIAANGTCTIKANVTTTATGTYNNTTNNLFVDTLDTGQSATASLTVNNAPATPAPICGLAMAQWIFPAGFSTASPVPSSSTVTASASPGIGITSTDFTEGADSWGSNGNVTVGPTFVTTNNEYVQFALNTTGFSSVSLTFDAGRKNTPNSPQGLAVYYGPAVGNPETGTSLYNNATALPTGTTAFSSFGSFSFTPSATTMYVRIYFFNSGNDNSGSDVFVDNVTFTGCATPTPPTIAKAFLSNPLAVNGTSTLTFTLSNANSIALNGVTFTDVLPTGLQVAVTPAVATTCGGTPTWAPGAGATTLTFGSPTGASIPASSSCTVSVNITGTASGAYQNVSGFISSTNGGTNTSSTGSATASLSVIKPPSIAKLFSPNPILANGTSKLTFTITNPNQNDALTGLSFTDTLPLVPGAMTVAAPLTTTNSCGGTLQDSLGGALASGDPGLRLVTGGPLAGGSTCTVTVNVTAATVGSYANTSGAVASTNGGIGNTALDTLTVNSPSPAIALLKQISTSPTGPWTSYLIVSPGTNVYYQFTLENSGDVTLSPVSVSDPSISGEESCAWPNTLPVADINDDDHIATCVVGPVVSVSGTNTNTATGSGTFGGMPYTSTSSSATYSTPAITLVKSVTETSFDNMGDTLSYSYLVTNSGFAPLLGPVTVTDDKIILPNTVTCPEVNTVGDLDAWFDPGESLTCTATYTVTVADMTAALVTNTASASASSVTSNDSSVTVYRSLADLTVTKVNNVSGSVAQNGSFDWTITVTNSGIADAVFANGQTIVSDLLPAGANYSPIIIMGGAVFLQLDCAINSGTFACVANGGPVTLPPGATFSATFGVSPTAAGSLANTATVDPNGNVLEISETNNTGLDTVNVIAPPMISKSFGTAIIPVGGNTTLTLTLTNPNTNPGALTNVQVDDTFPAGLTLQNTTFTFTPAACGTVINTSGGASAVGDNNVRFSAASLSVGANCQVVLNVTATTAGTKNNTTGNVTSTNGGTGNTASATLNVYIPPTVTKSFNPTTIAAGGTSVMTLTVTNPAGNPGTLTGIQLPDTFPTGMTLSNTTFTFTPVACGTVTKTNSFASVAGDNNVRLNVASLAVGASCQVTLNVTSSTPGTSTNTTTAVTTMGPIDLIGGTASASLGVVSAIKSVVGSSEDFTSGTNVAIGEIVRYRLVFELPEGTTTNLQVLDNIVTNLRYLNDGSTRVAFVCNSSAACATSSTASIGSNPVISGNGSNVAATFALPAATITNNSGGATASPFPSGDDPLFSLGNITNSDSDSDSEYVVVEFNVLIANLLANQGGNTRGNTFSVLVGGSTLLTSNNVNVTIVEPVIAPIIKSVIVTPTDGGDTITYQLQITHSAASTSPAFDISITDSLDSALTTPITVSGSTTGGACGFIPSSVSGSYSAPNATAIVTCLNPGGTATITITATVSSTAVSGKFLNNSASLTYTSLPGAGTVSNNTGSTTPGASGTSTGERSGSGGTNDYTATSNTVTTTLASPSLAKTINPAGTQYAIGAPIPYQITITVPEGVTGNPVAVLLDTIPTGLSYVAGSLTVTPQSGVTIGTAGPYSDINLSFFNLSGQTLGLNFGSFTSTASSVATNRTIVITFNVMVNNIVGNQSGISFINSVGLDITNPNGSGFVTLSASSSAVSVIEPVLTIAKAVNSTTPAYNSTLTYTLTVNHSGASNAPAYDVVVGDTLPSGLSNLTNVNISFSPGACTVVNIISFSSTSINATIDTLPLGCTVTITYDVTVSGALGSTQTNSVNATWTSQSGSVSGERTGADGVGGTLNDYAATASQSITVTGPNLGLAKTNGTTTVTAGGTTTYTLTATNSGNIATNGIITIKDVLPTGLSIANGPVALGGAQAANWSCTAASNVITCMSGTTIEASGGTDTSVFSFIVNVDTNASGTVINKAQVGGGGDSTNPNSPTDTTAGQCTGTNTPNEGCATDSDTVNTPSFTITKNADVFDVDAAGDIITYTVTLNNTGNVLLTGVSVDDPLLTNLDCDGVVGAPFTTTGLMIAVSENLPCTGTYTVTQNDIDTNGGGDNLINNTVTGDTNETGPQTASEIVEIILTPAHATVKTETSTGPYAVGDTITYDIVVTNTGNITLTGVTLTDNIATVGTCAPVQPASLAPNGTMTCSATHVVTQADVDSGSYVNTATGDSNQTPPNTSTVTVNFPQNPTHTTVKTETSTGPYIAGDTITYNIVVTNTGNITLTGVTVTDNSATVGSCTPAQPASLAPNGTMTCPATHIVTLTDINNGSYVNAATGDTNQTPPNTNTVTITFAAAPALTTVKSETSTGPYIVGDTITYDIVVTNTGNVTLTNVTVTDGSATVGTCTPVQPTSLVPNATMTCPASHVVTQTDVDSGSYVNTATGDSNETLPSTSTVTITFLQNPVHTTVKTETSTGPYIVGDTITYNIVVTNTGNITLTGVTVTDNTATIGTCTPAQPASLAPGSTMTCPASHVVTIADANNGSYSNTATGDTNQTPPSTSTVTISVLPQAPIAQDDSTTTPFNTPATLTNITANDTAFGTGNSIVINTIDLDPSTLGQQTSFTDVDGNQWSVNITTGDVTFTPATNYTGTATIPYSVQDASGQIATANLSVTVAPPASISGVVFHDVNLDGSKLASESGIVGVIVNLYDSTGTTLIASTTTGAGGIYNFPNLTAGNYLVVEIDPAGYVSSTANSVPVTLVAGSSGTADFGDYQLPNTALSNISGVVFNDANGNGVQDAGETPLSGVTVELENSLGIVIATTTTNASGAYTFTNLPAGTYTVVETDLPGYVSTTLNNIAVTLSAGTNATINFGDQTVVGNPLIADPAVTKLGTPSSAVVGDVVVYTITVGNNGNINATNVILTDTKPAFLDIISISISPNPGLTPVISGNTFTINFGMVAPTDFYTITVITRVNAQGVPPGGVNNAAITTSSGTDRTFNNAGAAQLIIASRGGNPSTVAAVTTLPFTGFAPNVVTSLPLQPSNMRYAATDLLLEIPSLGVKMPIVGISKKNGAWDVTWLGKQAGWLEGTAFPSWSGNSVLTSHVYDANGWPGPFVNLGKLKYGDKIIVHAYGQKYTFEVRTNQTVAPDDTSVLKHEEKPWLTLVTCKEYDEKTNTYKKRVIVRAVLVGVDWDK